jgi:hypothetical protein
MSSAFPQSEPHNAFSAGAAAVPVPERGTHIPAFYVRNPHHDPDLVVKQAGIPLLGTDKEEFTIAQIAPERRWAVLADGNLMAQDQFHSLKQQTIYEFYEMMRATGHPDAKYEGKITNEPIPDVSDFVSWRIDPNDNTKLLQIGYDENATDGARSEYFHDSKGEQIIGARLDILCQAYATPAGRAQMTEGERAEVEQHMGVTAAITDDGLAAKLEVMTDLHKSGALSSDAYLEAVQELTGKEPEIVVSDAKQPMTARCGKDDCKGKVGLKAHERACKKCKELIEAE